jgi:holliday junction DNA helicase RuvA
MIAHLRGRLLSVDDEGVVIDVQGVGYLVHCSARTVGRLPPVGEAVELHVETQLREDSLALYGFGDAAERVWFRLLQGIPGVGARVALSLLAALSPDELALAVAAEDRRALARAQGVGPRLAQRIVSELAGRIGRLPATVPPPAAGATDSDALAALLQLGYQRSEAHAALARASRALGAAAPLDQLIRASLKELAGG